MTSLARVPLGLLRSAAVRRVLHPLLRERATIFMLHRFARPAQGVDGHDPEEVRALLRFLKRSGYRVVGLRSIFEGLAAGEPLRGSVAFSIDDGYLDQAEVAGPLFAEVECPVTTFLCSGFLDGQIWMWWDRIEYVMNATRLSSLELPVDELHYRWASDAERRSAQGNLTEHCKTLPNERKNELIERLAAAAEVELPKSPPARYAPMSWSDARECEKRGMSFGAHSTTHPILSRAGDAQARVEIQTSIRRVSEELAHPDPIFCYPNGQAGDFGAREFATLAAAGSIGAVSGLPGYAEPPATPDSIYQVRRFSFPTNPEDLLQCVSGFERLKSLFRSGA